MCTRMGGITFFNILFIHERQWERERETQRHRQREAGSMQGARCRTRSGDPRVMPWAEGRCPTTEPPRHPNWGALTVLFCSLHLSYSTGVHQWTFIYRPLYLKSNCVLKRFFCIQSKTHFSHTTDTCWSRAMLQGVIQEMWSSLTSHMHTTPSCPQKVNKLIDVLISSLRFFGKGSFFFSLIQFASI